MNLEVNLMKDRQAWKYVYIGLIALSTLLKHFIRRHVFRDLRPYTCTFTSCANPNKLYATGHDWIYHEMQMHWRHWVCHMCDCPFDNKDLLVTHLNDKHPGSWTPRQLSAILEMSDRPIDESLILPCSLCKSELSIGGLLSQTAAHLEDISLFVLPNYSEEDNEANSSDAAGVGTQDGTNSSRESFSSSLLFSDVAVSERESRADDDGRPPKMQIGDAEWLALTAGLERLVVPASPVEESHISKGPNQIDIIL